LAVGGAIFGAWWLGHHRVFGGSNLGMDPDPISVRSYFPCLRLLVFPLIFVESIGSFVV